MSSRALRPCLVADEASDACASSPSRQQAQARVLAKATTGKVIGADPRCVLLTLGCQAGTPNRLLFV